MAFRARVRHATILPDRGNERLSILSRTTRTSAAGRLTTTRPGLAGIKRVGPRATPPPDPKLLELSARRGTAPRRNTARRPVRGRRTRIDERSAVVTIVPTALVEKGLFRTGTEKSKPTLAGTGLWRQPHERARTALKRVAQRLAPALKVSPPVMSPVTRPLRNHLTRWAEVPWVKESGTT